MKEGEERSQRTAQEDDVITIVDRPRKGVFISIQSRQDAIENRVRALGGPLKIAVELEELREQREDEGKRYLRQSASDHWVRTVDIPDQVAMR